MLSDLSGLHVRGWLRPSLYAPSGAGCFLTDAALTFENTAVSLNAPSGAGCFLAVERQVVSDRIRVLMHLLVLGAFWLDFGDKAVAKAMRS